MSPHVLLEMVVSSSSSSPTRPSTEVTCSACSAQTTVPFVPTPGRPVYCRECFAKRQNGPGAGPRRSPARRGRHNQGGGDVPRQRMLSMGRKTHFLYDARQVMERTAGGMDDQHHRAFLEQLFVRGARTSTEAAKEFLDEKAEEGVVTEREHEGLHRLLERYSQWR